MSLYVATYDVSDNRRRAKLARVLLRYGARVQESVFEVNLDPEDMAKFKRDVGSRLSAKDRFALFPIDERDRRRRLSWQEPPDRWPAVMVLQ